MLEVAPVILEDNLSAASLRKAIWSANIPALLCSLVCITGDKSLLKNSYRPNSTSQNNNDGHISELAQEEIREYAYHVMLRRMRDNNCDVAVNEELISEVLQFVVGEDYQKYIDMLSEEVDILEADPRKPIWDLSLYPHREFKVAIIGTGMSGILAAYRLQQSKIPYVIFEKNSGVGGTWAENIYPGCRVDNPSHVYNYSFSQDYPWDYHYSRQSDLLGYFQNFSKNENIQNNIRFNCKVTSLNYCDTTCTWDVHTLDGEGEKTHSFNAVILAVGQLNRPKMPNIPGMSDFQGVSFHSAKWDPSVDLTGKRVAIIGGGASAAQFGPEVAKDAESCVLYFNGHRIGLCQLLLINRRSLKSISGC